MDAKELASLLDGRQEGNELTPELIRQAKEYKLVIVYGASDDLMELDGAICEEIGANEGGTAYLDSNGTINGLLMNKCSDEGCPYYKERLQNAITIEAVWHSAGQPSWTFETKIPHEIFEIWDEDELYCRGIVFSLKDIPAGGEL